MLIIANPSKVKPGDSDAEFWGEYLKDEGENPDALDVGLGKIGIYTILKGGAGSGNFDHAGRPGEVGGSQSVGPVEDARDASKAEKLGLERAMRGKDGKWQMADGSQLPKHIREGLSQPIPPAWRNVYVNPDAKSCKEGCFAVRGRDVAGRIQGIYSKEFRGGQSEAKFGRVKELDGKILKVAAENDKNLKGPNKEEASVLRLIIATGIRPGSDDDTKAAKQAYGATTLLGKHVYKTRDGVELRFTGKKGVDLAIRVNDPKVAKEVLSRASAAGKGGRLYDTNYMSLWKYTKELDGKGYLPKDFRTLMGTQLAVDAMKKIKVPTNEKEYKKAVKEVATQVSSKLGNTPTIALQSYINPAVWGQWRKDWGGKKKQVGISAVLKGGEGSGSWNGPNDPRFSRDEEVVYHGTAVQNVASIKREGLKTTGGTLGEGVYATDRNSAISWAVSRWCQKNHKQPEEAGPNVKVALLKLKKEGFEERMGDYIKRSLVPPEDIIGVEIVKIRDWKKSVSDQTYIYLAVMIGGDGDER